MRVLNFWPGRYIVVFLMASLVVPFGVAETNPGPRPMAGQTTSVATAQATLPSAPSADVVPQTPSQPAQGTPPVQTPAPQDSSSQTTQNKQRAH